ncbi:MAG: hypothetical protein HQL24_04800 [Candidatus Omnitrophica bacterium]|nr:hypothetical protein [Candidatus Omnitrophota bacterium]
MKDDEKYQNLQESQLKEWEASCLRCGACCGTEDGDPCEYLMKLADKDEYYCQIYENRFGLHKTKNGKPFKCVPLRNILHKTWPGDSRCRYKA